MRSLAACCAILAASAAAAAGEMTQGSRTIRRNVFDIRFPLSVKGEGSAEILFHSRPEGDGYLVSVGPAKAALAVLSGGKQKTLAEAEAAPPGESILLIKRRPGNIAVYLGTALVLTAADKGELSGGGYAWRSTGGFSLGEGVLQDIAEIYFSDDFMRDTNTVQKTTQVVESHGSWTPQAGRWSVMGPGQADHSAAIFQLCYAASDKRGVYRAGYWFWEDYLFAASLRLGEERSLAALRFYEYAPDDYVLLQWDGSGPTLEVIRVAAGQAASLASKQMGFLPGQWYRIKLMVLDTRLRVFVDDAPVFSLELPGAVGGSIGLEAQGKAVNFDDVQVASLKLDAKSFLRDDSDALRSALRSAESREHATAVFSQQPTMKEWATPEGAWEDRGGVLWCDSVFYEGTLSWTPAGDSPRGTVVLILASETGDLAHGYRLVCSMDARLGKRAAWTFNNDALVAARDLDGAPEPLAIRVTGRSVELLSGEVVLLKDKLSAGYRGFCFGRAAGGSLDKTFSVSAAKLLDYPFTSAPAEWITTGTWELHPRWSCDLRFNWFSGLNLAGWAELWNKHRFEGDCTVEAFIAPMAIGNFPDCYTVPLNFRVTVGADEMKPNRGYTCVYGYTDRPAEILRNGVSVASDSSEVDATLYHDFSNARAEHLHRRWSHIKVQHRGSEVRFYVDRRLWLKFDDDQPLAGPFVGISTGKNGIMVSRVKITYENETGKVLVLR